MSDLSRSKVLLGVLALVGFTIAGFMMYSISYHYSIDRLWGHLLLFMWIGLWGGLLSLIAAFQKNRKFIAASTLSGAMLGMGFMPMPSFPLMFVGFLPLLWLVHQMLHGDTERKIRWLFAHAFNTFFIWNLISTWWVQNSSLGAGIFANVLNSIFMTLPVMLYYITYKRLGKRAAFMGIISYWMTFEIIHLNWDLTWPWLTLGNSFAHMPILVQWYEYTGVFGGTLWIWATNLMLADALLMKDANLLAFPKLLKKKWSIGFVLLFPILLSVGLYVNHKVSTDRPMSVLSVQPNFEAHYQKFSIPRDKQLAVYEDLTKKGLKEDTDYIIYPETCFFGIEYDNIRSNRAVTAFQEMVNSKPNLSMMLGLSTYKQFSSTEDTPESAFKRCAGSKCYYYDANNAAIQLTSNKNGKVPYYKKSKLVPGAEAMPFIGNIPFFKEYIIELGGAPMIKLGTQKERAIFKSIKGNIAPMICYESIFGDYVTGYIKKGAELLTVITNDSWWDNTAGHVQHMHLASLRAIETRRYVVRSANTGISCFINSRGDIYNKTDYAERASLHDTVYLRDDLTFYTQYGDLIGRISILLSGWLLFSLLAKGLQRKKEEA